MNRRNFESVKGIRHSGVGGGIFLVIALAAWVRFYEIGKPAIWSDEGFSLMLSVLSPSSIIFHTGQDVHPPLYYLVLHIWLGIGGDTIAVARRLSALFGLGTVGLGMWLTYLLSNRRASMLAGLLLSLFPFAVRYSQEIRMYAMLGFLMVGTTIAFVYWLRWPEKKIPLIVYTGLMSMGLYTHYFALICLASHWFFLFLLLVNRRKNCEYSWLRSWWLSNVAIVVIFSPWLPYLKRQLQFSGFNWVQPVDMNSWVSSIWQFVSFSDGLEWGSWLFFSVPFALLVISGVLWVQDQSEMWKCRLLVVYTWFPLFFVAAFSAIYPLFVDRYFLFSALGIPMLLAITIEASWPKFKVLSCLLMACVLFLQCFGVSAVYEKGHAVDKEVNRSDVLASYLNGHVEPGDEVVVTNGFLYFPFAFYNKTGVLPMLYTPARMDGSTGRPNGYQIWTLTQSRSDRIYIEKLECLVTRSGRVWLLGGMGNSPVKFPESWRLLSTFISGDAQVQQVQLGQRDAVCRG